MMNSETYEQVKRLFAESMDVAPAEQSAWLDANVADAAVRTELESLLAHDTQTNVFDLVNSASQQGDLPAPEKIERYRVTGILGYGGSGIVYSVEEFHPQRALALKVLRPGLFGSKGTLRFEREASILARLDHPGIARILRAGVTELAWGKVPFLAMELVRGGRVMDHVQSQNLNTKQRLGLWIQLCEAVAHAHGKGVIHRDLKPANVLINADGQIKIVDFGIGRLLDDEAGNTLTGEGQLVGTPEYMSPEQLSGDSEGTDSSTDTYALGLIGYQLLTGEHPYSFEGHSLTEIRRVMASSTAERASRRVASLRGDLETILDKALRKDPSERYASAASLVEDLNRYRRNEPILAKPATVGVKLRKFVQRNPLLVAGLVSTGAALLLGLATTLHQAKLARAETLLVDEARQQAERERDSALAMRDFLRFDLLQAARPSSDPGLGRTATIGEVLRQASLSLQRRGAEGGVLEDFPIVRASLHTTLGETFTSLGQYDRAQAELIEARRLGQETGDLNEILQAEVSWATLENSRSRYVEAERIALAAIELAKGPGMEKLHARLLGMRGHAVQNLDRPDEAIKLLREAREVQVRVLGPADPTTLSTTHNLSSILYSSGEWQEGEEMMHEVLVGRQASLGPSHPDTLASLSAVATIQGNKGDFEQCIVSFESILEQQLKIYGREHQMTYRTMGTLGGHHTRLGQFEEAQALLEEAAAGCMKVLGPNNRLTIEVRGRMAWLFHHRHEFDKARALYNELVPISEKEFGPESELTLLLRNKRGAANMQSEHLEQGIEDLEFVYEIYLVTMPADHPDLSTLRYKLGSAYAKNDQPCPSGKRVNRS